MRHFNWLVRLLFSVAGIFLMVRAMAGQWGAQDGLSPKPRSVWGLEGIGCSGRRQWPCGMGAA